MLVTGGNASERRSEIPKYSPAVQEMCVTYLQQFLECWLLSSLKTFCNFFLKITLKFSVLMLKSQ